MVRSTGPCTLLVMLVSSLQQLIKPTNPLEDKVYVNCVYIGQVLCDILVLNDFEGCDYRIVVILYLHFWIWEWGTKDSGNNIWILFQIFLFWKLKNNANMGFAGPFTSPSLSAWVFVKITQLRYLAHLVYNVVH